MPTSPYSLNLNYCSINTILNFFFNLNVSYYYCILFIIKVIEKTENHFARFITYPITLKQTVILPFIIVNVIL